MKEKMEKENTSKNHVEEWIEHCQKEGHVQQVAFSTYHKALTQICFSCGKVRTSMREEDI